MLNGSEICFSSRFLVTAGGGAGFLYLFGWAAAVWELGDIRKNQTCINPNA